MARSTVHYADDNTNNLLKKLHNKLRPAGTPVQRVEYIIELLLLRLFEVKLRHDPDFAPLIPLFKPDDKAELLFSSLLVAANDDILPRLNTRIFPFYGSIVREARTVLKGNPSPKLQDQLVLLEEVFGESNFTTAVQSGNMHEILELVAQIDETRILKSDLLGDAVESALSETGGTRDLGLFRTPDHIRQFMVGLVQPRIDDELLDPTAGTGGFMFDAYEYVMQRLTGDASWPGKRAHPELAAWFQRHFVANRAKKLPTTAQTTDFYRRGIMGIEYLGVIRKMAAINFYIRGLNPANILKGDALALFKKEYHPASKSAILANPPFGAERDQESYPDVWADYPRESETTILFVKLMLETLKKHGRCAVVVSEGFMTWDQNSARALRLELLNEAHLRAIISLPQGVFVSKGGQGPKTSILYFEKGGPTRDIWFYKVTNDGYTMGTSRKPQSGCQLVEALDLFHTHIAQGKTPPESRHAFTIPAAWIKQLDPRVKERIREETRVEIAQKAAEDRAKLEEKLLVRLAAKKLTLAERDAQLADHTLAWENKLHASIAQRIERAHLFSFNLPNHRSALTPEQSAAWDTLTASSVQETGPLDGLWDKLRSASLDELSDLLIQLDPTNALQLDLARTVLATRNPDELARAPKLKALAEALAHRVSHPRVKLKELIAPTFDKIKKEAYDGQLPMVEKISFADGKLHFRDDRETGMDLYRVNSGELVTSKINIHQGAVALAPCDLVMSTHYQAYRFASPEVLPSYLTHVLRSQPFFALLDEQKSKGIKNEQGAEFLGEFEIPLPPVEEQAALVVEIERHQAIITGAKLVTENWRIDRILPLNSSIVSFAEIADVDATILKDLGTVRRSRYVGGENIESGTGRLISNVSVEEAGIVGPSYGFRSGQVVYSKVRPNLRKCFLADFDGVCSSDIYPLTVRHPDVMPAYLAAVMASEFFSAQAEQFQERAGMPKVNRDQLAAFAVPVPSADKQFEVIALHAEAREMLRLLERESSRSGRSIRTTLANLWES